jgi:phosphoribosylformimino-5-aminoimidazole carboxamide ribotide isomerase
MEIIPAIDLKNGKCVRLYQGDYNKETIFSENPVEVAAKWESMGAKRLHIIDLDGAASGKPENLDVVARIIKKISVPIQLGGGIRDEKTVHTLIKAGVKRLIIGTVAVEQPDLIYSLCQKYCAAIIVSIDARDGLVATHGWLKDSDVNAIDLAFEMKKLGVHRFLYTDIKRDGTLTEPAYDSIADLIETVKIPVIAAGGISKLEHLKKLAIIGAEGAVIGRALYTGDIDLEAALSL